ncbi:hypothetical protein [Streptomyces sp. NPDC051310]|uniref:hypothetical protein n=1 Tax=Streptomyces sp. NPDC051310 TaxID=3365649 RepID=UPI0037B62D08
MNDKRHEGPGEEGRSVPRDLPDEQASTGSDHWDADLSRTGDEGRGGTPAGEPAPAEGAAGAEPDDDPAPEEPTG